MDDEKKAARQKFMAVRADYRPQWLKEKSHAVCARLLAWPVFARAADVMGYLAFDNEVDIDELLAQAIAIGKRVYVPFIPAGRQSVMRAARLRSFSGLARGRYGIRAPENADAGPERLDLVLAPGLAFTEKGGRLGLGSGHYDRFLADWAGTVKAGVTLAPQVAQELPLARWDIKMDFLATEQGITDCRQI